MKWQSLPPILLYPILIPHVVKLCLKYRTSLSIITQANPCFKYGGLPFESKAEMFSQFNGIVPYCLIKSQWSLPEKLNKSMDFIKTVHFPVIIKPDTGHRGIDVHLIKDKLQLQSFFQKQKWDYILQKYIDKPFEFGIFYCKLPFNDSKIISLSLKVIPFITGDGKSTIQTLIKNSKIENKAAVQNHLKDKLDTILDKNTKLQTMITASHAQGSMFYNAEKYYTKQMHDKTNHICNIPGFHFGRLDVKAASIEDFKNGNFDVIEINGATSESIHIYDNLINFRQGMKILKRQWDLLFQISKLNYQKSKNLDFLKFLKLYIIFFIRTKQITGKLY